MLEIGYFKHGQYGVVDFAELEETAVKRINTLRRAYPHRNGTYIIVDAFNGELNVLYSAGGE